MTRTARTRNIRHPCPPPEYREARKNEHRLIAVAFALSATIAGCQINNNQTDHQRDSKVYSVSTGNLLASSPPSTSGNPKESPTTPTNNNAGQIIAMIGNALASPFVYVGQQMDYASGHTPKQAVAQMENASNADWRRIGITDLVTSWDYARKPPYTTRYQQIAKNDPDYTVRAAAIRALNISRDQSATPIFITALDDESELVRLEAAKALANVPDPAAIPALMRRLNGQIQVTVDGRPETVEEGKDVRIACADALRHYRTLDVARTLVSYLGERDFGVAWQSLQSLKTITGRDMEYNQGAWLQYLSGPEKPFG
jgi:hypothetical protein